MKRDQQHPVDDYATRVGSGELVTNKWVKLACLRHEKDVEKYGRKPSDGLWFSEKAAQDVIDFFPKFLQFYEGDFDSVPFTLTPSQAFIIGSIFGWKKGQFRRFKTAYIEQAKGQGKSPLAAGVGLFCLVADDESGAEIYSAAVTREQAGILFRDAKAFVEKSPSLRKKLNVGVANITYIDTNSFFRPVSSERRGLDGKRPHVCLIDEIHEHPNDIVVRKMGAGRKTRRQPIIFEITNAGYDRNSICYQHHEHTEKILEEVIQDDAWFGYMTGLDVCESCTKDGKTVPQDGCPNCDDWRDENVWIKANPNLPYLGEPFREYLRMQVEEAKSMAAQENIVKRLNFCIWCVALGTLITMADGTRRRAEELVSGDIILAFDENTDALVCATVKKVADNGIHPIYKITTARGRIAKVTGNHRFWTRMGRTDSPKYGWTEAEKLSAGSRVAVALGNDISDGQTMDLGEAYILGVMMGDGSCKGSPRVTNEEIGIINACNIIMKPHGCEFFTQSNKKHHHVRQLRRGKWGSWLTNILKKHGLYGEDCYSKRVPESVFRGGIGVWSAFLSGYLDTDGYILKEAVAWCSINRGLLSDCQHILALMGANASLNAVQAPGCRDGIFWRLEVRDDRSIGILCGCLSPAHPRKAARLKNLNTTPTYNGISSENTRKFDRIKNIEILSPAPTVGIEIEGIHTHVTDGLITHNTESITKWLPADSWSACAEHDLRLDDFAGQSCYYAFDLANKIDISALMLVFIRGDELVAFGRYYLPEDTIKRSKIQQYPQWVREKRIIATPGAMTDYKYIEDDIKLLNATYPIAELSFDPKEATYLVNNIMEWLGQERCIEISQVPALISEPMKQLEGLVYAGKIHHDGDPVLGWMISNVVLKPGRSGGPVKFYYPTKTSNDNKIDGAVALIMGVSRAMLGGGAQKSAREGMTYEETLASLSI